MFGEEKCLFLSKPQFPYIQNMLLLQISFNKNSVKSFFPGISIQPDTE